MGRLAGFYRSEEFIFLMVLGSFPGRRESWVFIDVDWGLRERDYICYLRTQIFLSISLYIRVGGKYRISYLERYNSMMRKGSICFLRGR